MNISTLISEPRSVETFWDDGRRVFMSKFGENDKFVIFTDVGYAN